MPGSRAASRRCSWRTSHATASAGDPMAASPKPVRAISPDSMVRRNDFGGTIAGWKFPQDVGGCRGPVRGVVEPVEVVTDPPRINHFQRNCPPPRCRDRFRVDVRSLNGSVSQECELGLGLGMDEPRQVKHAIVRMHVGPQGAEVRLVDPEGAAHRFGRPTQLVSHESLAPPHPQAIARDCNAPRFDIRQVWKPLGNRLKPRSVLLGPIQIEGRSVDELAPDVTCVLRSRHDAPSPPARS